ncbi:hypothetical protein CL633_00585 [bacterium]|nr:hypothetical protein [bacterium]|tara:strand:- start:29331 stop:29528 length:198 start_codon:yes stop_codon:yes gene_type:complete
MPKNLQNREKFLKIYNNLPLSERKGAILVLDDKEPISWEVAYIEISNNTLLGKIILKKLKSMSII